MAIFRSRAGNTEHSSSWPPPFPMIYLDHNATSPILPAAADAVREASLQYGANPGSQHEPGRQARRALEDARERFAELLGARTGSTHPDRVIFTSGGTEANNLALFGLLGAKGQAAGHLVTSAIEHPSILEPAERLQQQGCRVTRIGVNKNGIVRLDEVEQALGPETRLVSLMLGNNETGVLQPIAEVAPMCAARGIPLHSDAAQVVGKLPVHFAELGLAMLSCAAHKFRGPLGIGALVVRHDVALQPIAFGGHQQADLRPGTDTVALAIGMLTALEHRLRNVDEQHQKTASLRDHFERQIQSEIPAAVVIGQDSPRLPNTSNIAFVGLNRQALVMALDLEGIACSTGSACSSGSSELSPTLVAMGLDKQAAEGAIRFSLGTETTSAEINLACRRILRCCQRLRQAGNL